MTRTLERALRLVSLTTLDTALHKALLKCNRRQSFRTSAMGRRNLYRINKDDLVERAAEVG
jgi:hypothetical protein